MPPSPSGKVTSYGPMRVPGLMDIMVQGDYIETLAERTNSKSIVRNRVLGKVTAILKRAGQVSGIPTIRPSGHGSPPIQPAFWDVEIGTAAPAVLLLR